MRTSIFIVVLIFPLLSFSQNITKEDSLQLLFDKAADHLFGDQNPHLSIKVLDQAIQLDSSHFKFYYLRALSFSKASEQGLWDSHGRVLSPPNDTNLITQFIKNIDNCIGAYQLYQSNFPSNMEWSKDPYQVPETRTLGEMTYNHQNTIDGLLFYINGEHSNHKKACECWKNEKDSTIAKPLIIKYCK